MHKTFFIGSLPFQDVKEAIQFVKEYSPHLPFLPQLPELNPEEDMYGQMLRGLELGFWDSRASVALELFQNEFSEAPEIKVQCAGPYSLSRMTGSPVKDLIPLWIRFWRGFSHMLRLGAFRGKIWLQLDEPLWSGDRQLPPSYQGLLEALKADSEVYRLGMHTCAKDRPAFPQILDFISLNFVEKAPSGSEWEKLREFMSSSQKVIMAGVFPKGEYLIPPWIGSFSEESLWVSSPCGLYDWSRIELENTFQRV